MVKIRLQRCGKPHRPFYRVVVIDSKKPRDSAPLEVIGTYDPLSKTDDGIFKIDSERLRYWLNVGAQPTKIIGSLLNRFREKSYRGGGR